MHRKFCKIQYSWKQDLFFGDMYSISPIYVLMINQKCEVLFWSSCLPWDGVHYCGNRMDLSSLRQRSIEDEVVRESAGDEFTIVVSYLIMFGYIAITLGQVSSVQRALVSHHLSLSQLLELFLSFVVLICLTHMRKRDGAHIVMFFL